MISTGKRELGGGFERYTFEISVAYVMAASRLCAGNELLWKRRLCHWYLLSPRPEPRDIVSSRILPGRSTDTCRISMTIRRGHLLLLHYLRQHKSVAANIVSGGIELAPPAATGGDGDFLAWILSDSYPDYGQEFLGLGGDSLPEPSVGGGEA